MELSAMSLHPPTVSPLDSVAPGLARAERAALAFRDAEGERLAWPRAVLVVGGVSLVLWAAIVHLAVRFLG
jgi:hypothetical protein